MTMTRGVTFPLLDHGYVKLIDWMGSDETIVEAARMSTGKGFISWESYARCESCGFTIYSREGADAAEVAKDCKNHKMVEKLDGDQGFLEFLLANKHTTPFEMCELAIEVQAPIFVFREWHRHRTQSYNEFSARYSQMPNIHYIPEATRLIPVQTKNKQAQGTGGEVSMKKAEEALTDLKADQERVYRLYEDHLEAGVPKEIARINTPVSRYSKMRAKTDLWNWLNFLRLRMAPNAMWEIRQYANQIAVIIAALFPRSLALFEEHTLHAVTFSRSEMKALRAYFENHDRAREHLLESASDVLDPKKTRALLDKVR